MKKKIHHTRNYARKRLVSPNLFIKRSFRTKQVAPGVKIIIGRLKQHPKKYHIQAILKRR